jgi:hypothetical protein
MARLWPKGEMGSLAGAPPLLLAFPPQIRPSLVARGAATGLQQLACANEQVIDGAVPAKGS